MSINIIFIAKTCTKHNYGNIKNRPTDNQPFFKDVMFLAKRQPSIFYNHTTSG